MNGKALACLCLTRMSYPGQMMSYADRLMLVGMVVALWRWIALPPPRTTSRQHRPHSGLSLTHSTPGDHTPVRPPGHWLRPVISQDAETLYVETLDAETW